MTQTYKDPLTRSKLIEIATSSARIRFNYSDVERFRKSELKHLRDANMYAEANALERLAMRSALSSLLNQAKWEAQFGYETEDEKQKLIENKAEYESYALKLAEELGIDSRKISQKFDNIKIKPWNSISIEKTVETKYEYSVNGDN